ncbi:MAG: discoidin domain-containing protein [Thermoanaerobaculia bacterium]
MRLDIDFQGHGGYAIARKEVDIELPENWEFTFRIRGDMPRNNLEFKLIDPSGENVWWSNQRMFEFTDEWRLVRLKKREIGFAWGPKGGGEIERVSAIEFAISVGMGGKGTVWIDELTFREREPDRPYDLTPTASGSVASGDAAHVLDGDPATVWRAPGTNAWIELDFLRAREFGGAAVTWSEPHASAYVAEISDDRKDWIPMRRVEVSNGGRDYLFLPEAEARYFRLRLLESGAGSGFAIRDLEILSVEVADSKTAFFQRIAEDAPRGTFPRWLYREQSYWTVAGAPADEEEILLNEDGMIEAGGVGGFSIEPLVWLPASRELVTWADVQRVQSLAGTTLPIPSVAWSHPAFVLETTAMTGGEPGQSAARAVYRIENRAPMPLAAVLAVAIRPFQVNPPWQFLNIVGGFSEIRSIRYDGVLATVNEEVTLAPTPVASAFGATRFEAGTVIESLRRGTLPEQRSVTDPFGAASGAFVWRLELAPGESRTVAIEFPLHDGAPAAPAEAEIEKMWSAMAREVGIDLPPAADEIEESLESNLAYILVNQDGPAIQPGSRSYDRSWIRDGSLTSAALLRFGRTEAVRRFIEWYAGFQREDGYVPCCVGKRGADPVPEHDSHGQLVFAIAEYVRHTNDLDFARSMWPHVAAAVDYIDELRHQRMTPEYEDTPFWGLLPESISHEGYSAKPMHSYWDQLFALKGLKDAVRLAETLGLETERARIEAIRDEYRQDLAASIRGAMERHGIDYVPGSVELGDFDATSTTIALEPAGAREIFPPGALERTFEKYWENFVARRDSGEWENYTPYEHRVVGAFIRLGWIDRAHEALDWFMGHRRPAAWNHWAEVVWNDPRTPKFIGDMPHTWVGSDFMRSVVDFLAYERDEDRALVIGAGITEAWAREGVEVRGLRTHYGPLTYTVRPEGDSIRIEIAAGTEIPPGGIVVALPFAEPQVIRALPAAILLELPIPLEARHPEERSDEGSPDPRLRLATPRRIETRLRRSFAHTLPPHLAQDDGNPEQKGHQ